MSRTPAEWAEYCERHITAGYVPGRRKSSTYASGVMMTKAIDGLIHFTPGCVIVDVGCGNGRLAFGLMTKYGKQVIYHGLEIVEPSVTFCTNAFTDCHNFHFYHLNLTNKWYWPKGALPPDKVTYPLPDGVADFVVASSLFSHTGTIEVAARNLFEMQRVTKPVGTIYTTWILGDKHDPRERRTFYTHEQVEALLEGLDYFIIPPHSHDGVETRSQTVIVIRRGNV